MFKEPKIIINGKEMSEGESMTIRVALSSFFVELQDNDALGKDKIGREIARLYRENMYGIFEVMRSNQEDGG